VVCFATVTTVAQKGTAGPGFYPQGYQGDTWTGEVASADEATRELTLTYKSGDKTQTFIAYIPDGGAAWGKNESGDKVLEIFSVDPKKANKPSKPEPPHINLADFLGRRLTVYYIHREQKDANGQKLKFNEVFWIKIIPKK
jgi:hypothetical protein